MTVRAVKRLAPVSAQMLMFARNFFKYPAMLGSLIPSSPFLVSDVVDKVKWEEAGVVVELGPGVGTITREILKRMRVDAVLIAIELNDEFASFLLESFRDSRLHVVRASASAVRQVLANLNLPRADYIISGIPYTTISHSLRREILEESRLALNPDGVLLVYQFTSAVLPYLKSSFANVKQYFQLLNVLPARIFRCTLRARPGRAN